MANAASHSPCLISATLPETLQLLACRFWGGAGSRLLLRRMLQDRRNKRSTHRILHFHANAATAWRNFRLKPVRGEDSYFQGSVTTGVSVLGGAGSPLLWHRMIEDRRNNQDDVLGKLSARLSNAGGLSTSN